MNYPPGFSSVSRARVAAAKEDAEIAFTQKTRHTKQIADVEKELLILIGVVTLKFAKQACVAGVESGWDIEAISECIKEFFKDFCRKSYYAKHPAPGLEDEYENFEWDMWRGLEDSDTWLEHRERLIAIATTRIEAEQSNTQDQAAPPQSPPIAGEPVSDRSKAGLGRKRSSLIQKRRDIVNGNMQKPSDFGDSDKVAALFEKLDRESIPLPSRAGSSERPGTYANLRREIKKRVLFTLKKDLQRSS